MNAITSNATKEAAEPAHADNAGGTSVWWKWTPSFSGRAALDTHGSGFDTLLAVYTGTSLNSLTQVAANNDDGTGGGVSGLAFIARSGTEYMIAVDGAGGASGRVTLSWNLSPEADLAVSMGVTPTSALVGEDLYCAATIFNFGPSTAQDITVTSALPDNVQFVSASTGCSLNGSSVICDLGSLLSGSSAETLMVFHPQVAGTVQLTTNASSQVTDPLPTNNNASVDAQVAEPPQTVPSLSSWGIAGIVAFLGSCLLRRTRCDKKL